MPQAGTLDAAHGPSPAVRLLLAESSYRFSVSYTAPDRDLGDLAVPKRDETADGVVDASARVLRAESVSGTSGSTHQEFVVIGDQAWSRLEVGGNVLMGWVSTFDTIVLDGLHPWRIPAAVEEAENLTMKAGEYNGTLDLTADPVEGLASFAIDDSELDATAVPFTLTLDGEGRPASFRFETTDGNLSADYEFSDYGVAVDDEPPPVEDPIVPPGTDPRSVVCLKDGEIVPCKD